MKKTILVTGSEGYVGRHVVSRFLDHGLHVIGVDFATQKSLCRFSDEESIQLDLRDRSALDKLFSTKKIDGVIHLASYIEVGESIREPIRYYENNLGSSLELVTVMQKYGVKNLVFASSAATYGDPGDVVLREESTPRNAVNPYGKTKVLLEEIFEDLSARGFLSAVSLRFFNIAGMGSVENGFGRIPLSMALIIPLLCKIASSPRPITQDEYKRLAVLAKGYPTPDGTVVRDYVHVVDIAEACLAAYQAIGLDPSVSGPYNIASGQSHSIQDVIRTVEALTGHRFEIEWQEAQKGFPIYLKTDRQKAERILRWVPRHSSLENLVSSMWKAVKSEIRG